MFIPKVGIDKFFNNLSAIDNVKNNASVISSSYIQQLTIAKFKLSLTNITSMALEG